MILHNDDFFITCRHKQTTRFFTRFFIKILIIMLELK